MATRLKEVDAVIVGMGWTGSIMARELTKASLNEIGDAFGGRDHGTVLHACKLVKKRMVEQDNLRQTISFIDSSLQR